MRRIVLLLSSMVAGVLLLASGMLPSITYGQTTTASFTDVSAGGDHRAALQADGTVWEWGYLYGEERQHNTPVLKKGVSDVIDVAAGADHTVALKKDGTVWTWGSNSEGQLGNGTTASSDAPVQVKGENGAGYLTDGVAVEAGAQHVLALKSDGTVRAWGANYFGELGDGTRENKSTPVQVHKGNWSSEVLTGVKDIAVGTLNSLALKNDGTVWAWGNDRLNPAQVVEELNNRGEVASYLTNVTDVATGSDHSIAVKSDGTVWTWGTNSEGQLGNGSVGTSYRFPARVKDESGTGFLTNAASVAAGPGHSLAVMKDGTLRAWGSNDSGELGDGTFADKSLPVQAKINGVKAVDGGGGTTVALKSDGTVWAWGRTDNGQLGDPSTRNPTPVKVVFPDPTPPPDTTPPRVTSTVPSANATGVAPTVNVKATFSEDMMASTINKTTFTLRKQNTTGFVDATVTYDPSTDTATLDPTNSLKRGATYKASVNLGAQDQAGNPLDQNDSLSGSQRKDWTFKIRP
jgi:alpha-tubulin suppressor-like RCC1 family protein